MVLSNDIAALVGFACEAVMYGVYCVLFLISSSIFVWRRRDTGNINWVMAFANTMLFATCTSHFALEFNHFYTTLRATGVPDYANETHTLFGADILLSLADFLGDMVLMYRCWCVWGKNYYIIVLPFLTALGGFACAMEVLHLLLGINPSAPVPPASLVPLGIAGYVLPLCTNVMVTSLIVGRIWWETRGLSDLIPAVGTKRLTQQAMKIIIESGALYLVTQLIFVILYSIKHPAVAIVAVIAAQIYGMAPTLIIIQVGLGMSSETSYSNDTISTRISWSRPAKRQQDKSGFSSTGFTEDSGPTLRDGVALTKRKSEGTSDSISSGVAV